MIDHNYFFIMAGGSGTRLYPWSRENQPKQFQKFVSENTLFQDTYFRLLKLTTPDHIFVSTLEKYGAEILAEAKGLPKENVVFEPCKKNTAAPMALITAMIFNKDPQAIVMGNQADCMIRKPQNFWPAVKIGLKTVAENTDKFLIVTSTPDFPHPGMGYIKKGRIFKKTSGQDIFLAEKFVEKPGREKAIEFVNSGEYFWNSGGHFVWKAETFLKRFAQICPEIYAGINQIVNNPKSLGEEFSKLPEAAIEPAFLEKCDNILVLATDLGYSDIGSWEVVSELVKEKDKDDEGNYGNARSIFLDTHNTMVFSRDAQKLVATIGLDNIEIITTDDVILVMERGRGQEVKKVVEELKKRKLDKFL